jgi:hypothetical protein
VPQAPNTDGLPVWLQITVSLIFVAITAFMAFIGYQRRLDREPPGAASTVFAAIPDMSAVRQLTDQARIVAEHLDRVDASLRDNVHYLRDQIDVMRENSVRMRELREEIVRSDLQRARRLEE